MNVRIGKNSSPYVEKLRGNKIETYSSLGRTSAKINQVSSLAIEMIIFDVDMYSVVLHMSYILIYVNCL